MSENQRKPPIVSNELLRTKLAPPRLPADQVPRASLLARLDEGRAGKLTLISAPAGFGKSTLVAEWIQKRLETLAPARSAGVRDSRLVYGANEESPISNAQSQISNSQSLRFAWLSLDAGDNDPIRFWRYAITACRAFDAALGKPALAALRTAQQPAWEALLTTFINELAELARPGVLVLEDYHFITTPQIHDTLTFFLDHLPATLHLVLITRSQPPLPLARWRSRNELRELGPADLRLSPEETRIFLQRTLHVSLSPEAVARLEEQTEGWAAGLRLAALALEGRAGSHEAEEFVATFSGGHRHILEYLTGEVLAAQPEAVQEFLLRTSFLPRLTGSLCDAVRAAADVGWTVDEGPSSSVLRPSSASILEYLERSNLFLIPLNRNDSDPWYRYHTLFGEAMRHYARRRLGEAEVRALHEKASLWYAAHGLPDEAIDAAIAARQFARAAALIEQLVETRGLNELHTIRRWTEQLPQDVLRAHPALCFNYAMALLFTSDRYAPTTAALLETPLRMAEEAWKLEKNDSRHGQVLSLRAIVALWQGDLDRSFAYSRQALELLDEHDALWRGTSLNIVGLETLLAGQVNAAQRLILEARALSEAAQNIHARLVAAFMLGETYAWQGEFDQASQYYQQVLAQAVGGEEMLDDQGRALLGLGAIAFERNDLATAEQHASRALEIGHQRSDEGQRVRAALLLARVEHARGQTAPAQERLRALAAQTRRMASLREIQAWQAWLALAVDDLAAAEIWYATVATQDDPVTLAQQEQEAMIIVRLHLAQGNPQAALDLGDWRADAHAQGRTRSEVEILCLQALAHAAQSDLAQAERTLTRALMIAQPRGFRRVFLDQGPRMAALLQATIPQIAKRPLAAYATSLLRTLASSPTGSAQLPASPLLEPLSPQEQRVLRLLAAGLSNPEIARELVVSINTVKTQVKSIFRKLDVSNRQEAAEAARELNLL